jgi:DNA polymerase I-like protein with 3'-5' exonuclease and polymerase domains
MRPITDEGYKLLHDGCVALSQVEANGIRVDTDYLQRAITDTGQQIKELSEQLKKYKIFKVWRKTYGSKTNIDSREQLGKILFDVMKYTCHSYTKTGNPQANEENLKSTGLEFVSNYLRLQKLKKARSTYLHNILRETVDGFMHPNFPLHLVRSFRGSSDHPNFTNMPIRDPLIAELVRQAIIARINHCILEIDFKGAEICAATCYHKDPRMIRYIEKDPGAMHKDMAAELYMLSKSQVSKDTRYAAKNRFVFAEFYGDWYKNRAPDLWHAIEELNLTIKGTDIDLYSHLESQGIIGLGACHPDQESKDGTFERHVQNVEYAFWNKRFKVYNQWKKDWWKEYQETGFFETLTGFIIEGLLDRKQAINYPIQGTAFHWLLWCLIQIQKQLKKYKMKSVIVGQIHDSIVGDIHKREVKDYLSIVKQVIYEDLPKHWPWIIVPLIVEAEQAPVGASWYAKKEIEL